MGKGIRKAARRAGKQAVKQMPASGRFNAGKRRKVRRAAKTQTKQRMRAAAALNRAAPGGGGVSHVIAPGRAPTPKKTYRTPSTPRPKAGVKMSPTAGVKRTTTKRQPGRRI